MGTKADSQVLVILKELIYKAPGTEQILNSCQHVHHVLILCFQQVPKQTHGSRLFLSHYYNQTTEVINVKTKEG